MTAAVDAAGAADDVVAACSRLLDVIYECANDESRWPEALHLVAANVSAGWAALAWRDSGAGQVGVLCSAPPLMQLDGMDIAGQAIAVLQRGGADLPRLAVRPLPQGTLEPYQVVLVAGAGPEGAVDGAALDRLVPHIARTIAIGSRLGNERQAQERIEAALDRFRSGVLLVSDRQKIFYANRSARKILAERRVLMTRDGLVYALDAALSRRLQQAVERACGIEATSVPSLIPLDGASLESIHVVPVPAESLREGVDRRLRCAAIFLREAGSNAHADCETLSALYRLTPAEAAVFAEIAAGHNPGIAARRLGIAPSTVRTHLLRVFEKTGVRRQADLVRLAASHSLP